MEILGWVYRQVSAHLEQWLPQFLENNLKSDPDFWMGRLGRYRLRPGDGAHPRIWFHAASVGEVTGAMPILKHLRGRLPQAEVFLTVSTPMGFRFALSNLAGLVQVLPFPIDFPAVLTRALDALRPDLYVGLESEFWPNLFRFLDERRVPMLLLNGRLSARSAYWYGMLKPLFRPIFARFLALAMHSEADRQNIMRLGAPPDRTTVLGSSKYDALRMRKDAASSDRWRDLLALTPEEKVVVGGSLRRSECLHLLEIFFTLRRVDERLTGIFAPRHLRQVPRMVRWLERQGLPFQLLSNLESARERRFAPVILVDRMGMLFDLYSLGDLIFCGGTLEPVGAHNIMEPAAWEKAVFYGPHLQNVLHEHNILQETGGSFLVRDPHDLLGQWRYWKDCLAELKRHGENAGRALSKLGGVAARQVDLVVAALEECPPRRP